MSKKTSLILGGLFLALCLSFTSITSDWLINVDDAKKTASSESKHILLSFQGSDWCGNCMRLEKTLFESEEFKAYASENLVLLKADFPMKRQNKLDKEQTAHNEGLAEQFNTQGSFPKVVILNTNGELVGTMKYPLGSAKEYISSIQEIVK